MIDISKIPDDELERDRLESIADAAVCRLALLHGIQSYSGGASTAERLRINEAIVAKIEAEQARRTTPQPTATGEE